MTIKVTDRMLDRAHFESRMRKVAAVTSRQRREVYEFIAKVSSTPHDELTPDELERAIGMQAIARQFGA